MESVKKADDSDKSEKLKELESLVYDIKDIDPVKEEQQLKSLLQKSNKHLEFEVSFVRGPHLKSSQTACELLQSATFATCFFLGTANLSGASFG